MTILDQLLEKKDLLIYIDERIAHLESKFDLGSAPPSERQFLIERLRGRIRELRLLKDYLSQDKLKDQAKRFWEDNHDESCL